MNLLHLKCLCVQRITDELSKERGRALVWTAAINSNTGELLTETWHPLDAWHEHRAAADETATTIITTQLSAL